MGFFTLLDQRAVAYAMASMGLTFGNVIFNFYYTKMFLNIYHIDEKWFQVSQILFMIWNAINDPLFAYVQDTSAVTWCRVRRLSILYSSFFFAISFLLPWFPWADYQVAPTWIVGVHLLLSLCLYDTLFTFIGLALCALSTEISTDYSVRVRLVRYSQVASMISHSTVFVSEHVSSNLSDLASFRIFCVAISILSCIALSYGGRHGKCATELEGGIQQVIRRTETKHSYLQLTVQIFTQRNFICFVIMNFLQLIQLTAGGNFLRIFAERLIFKGGTYSSLVQTLFYGLYPLLPEVLVFVGSPFVLYYGTYKILICSFIMKISLGLMTYLLGPGYVTWLMIYYLMDFALAKGTFSLFNLVISDIIDADMQTHKRSAPISSMMFGSNALITKPAHSVAPMLVVAILNMYGYEELSGAVFPSSAAGVTGQGAVSEEVVADVEAAMFLITCLLPPLVGCLQLITFSPYTIRHSHTNTNTSSSKDSDTTVHYQPIIPKHADIETTSAFY